MDRRLPPRLILVALLFVLGGWYGLWKMVDSLEAGVMSIHVEAVWLLHGWGLLRLRESSRLGAVGWIWFVRLSSIAALLISLVFFDKFEVRIWNWHPEGWEKLVAAALIILPLQLLCSWVLRVLKDERLVQLFFDAHLSELWKGSAQEPREV